MGQKAFKKAETATSSTIANLVIESPLIVRHGSVKKFEKAETMISNLQNTPSVKNSGLTGIPVGAPKDTLQVFFFLLYFNKKYVKVEINDYTMHLIISKWLRMQKCRQLRKKMRQKVETAACSCFSFSFCFSYVLICYIHQNTQPHD